MALSSSIQCVQYSTVQLVDWPRPGVVYTCTSCYNSWRSTNGCLDKLLRRSIQFVSILLVKIKEFNKQNNCDSRDEIFIAEKAFKRCHRGI